MNYYRMFLQRCSEQDAPLYAVTKKSEPFKYTPEAYLLNAE